MLVDDVKIPYTLSAETEYDVYKLLCGTEIGLGWLVVTPEIFDIGAARLNKESSTTHIQTDSIVTQ